MDTAWKKIWSKRHSIRLSECWCYGAMGFEKTHGVPFPRQLIEIEDSFATGYIDENEYRRMLAHFVDRIKKNGFDSVLGTAEDEYRSFLAYTKTISAKDFSILSLSELRVAYDEFVAREDHWMHFMWPVFALDEGLTPEFQSYIETVGDRREEIEGLVLVPEKETAAGQYHTDIVSMLAGNPSEEQCEAEIGRLAEKYAYFTILNMDEEPLSKENVRKAVMKCKVEVGDLSAYLEAHGTEQQKRSEQFDEFLNSLDQETANLLYAVRQIGYLREYRNDIRQEAYLHARELYREIGQRHELSLGEVIYCTRKEIKGFLSGTKNLPSKEVLAERRRYTHMYCDNETVAFEWMKGERAEAEDISEITEIKGTTAFKGSVTGRACVILDVAKEGGAFQEGDVLVTTTTNLSFVPLMGKASAIVTEEGGLLTHTAIVARELKKPCVIGTKIATRVFKTGNMIEVDANNGIVRLL
jgi:phosphoenolpyruvate synthase/pyruvate phosphate dikinase